MPRKPEQPPQYVCPLCCEACVQLYECDQQAICGFCRYRWPFVTKQENNKRTEVYASDGQLVYELRPAGSQ